MAKRVIGIVRVSEQGDREDDSFHSPEIQADAMRQECDERSYRLLDVEPEIDVSGGLPLERRPVLRAAVEAVERGDADIIMAPYLDRLCRDRRVQDEVRDRVQAAGGSVVTLDLGEITNGTPEREFLHGIMGDVNELQRKVGKVKSADGQRRAVEAKKFIGPVPPGYVKGADGRLVVDAELAPYARAAFERRAAGASYADVRGFLAANGIERTVSGVRAMLRSRAYLGEVNFGELHNLHAHDAIITRELFDRVQRTRVSAGVHAKSPRILARLGVLRCSNCGGRMSASSGGGYPFYRCSSQDCSRPQTIGAAIVEPIVIDATKAALADVEGRASVEANARAADAALAAAETVLESTLRMLCVAGMDSEPAAVERLTELRRQRDDARDRVAELGTQRRVIRIDAARDWDRLTQDERRALIVATVERVTVAPGRGQDRVSVELGGE